MLIDITIIISIRVIIILVLAHDKGGPSKGGFLNNR